MGLDPRLQPLLGVWCLDRQRSDHGPVALPARGVSTILAEDGPEGTVVWFDDRVVDASGHAHQAGFKVPLDGTPRILEGADRAALSARMDGETLVVDLHRGKGPPQRARRRVTLEDEVRTLTLEQALTLPDGRRVETRGVYRPARVKQVICYRRDLKMRKGKIAAQVAHASLAVLTRRDRGPVDALHLPVDGPTAWWVHGRSAKIVLSVADEAALLAVHEAARKAGLPAALITDAGKTEFHGTPTRTTVAVGPATAGEIDAITGPDGAVDTKLA